MPKILVIEDNENNRVLLTRRLKAAGHEVLTAEDAEQGLALAQSALPNLIRMDIGLPGLDGWAATRLLKAHPATQHIAIIALTAHAMQGDREKAAEAGCDAYETKPVDFARFFEKIDTLLQTTHAGAANPQPPQ